MADRLCMNCMRQTHNTVCDHCGYNNDIAFQNIIGLKPETLLHERYMVGRTLGQGGFGITYVGYDMLLNIKVAIKEYFPNGSASRDNSISNELRWPTSQANNDSWKEGCNNFLKEARRMAKVDAVPSIVRVRDTFFENNTAYIIMDFVEGITLKAHLQQKGIMGITQCVRIMRPLLEGLSAIHKLNLIHRDISPDNIMIDSDGKLKLLDLGAAKDMETAMSTAALSQRVTKKGFSPPEQYMEQGHIGSWTDVYAIAATIYYCITGRNIPDAMDRVMNDPLSFNVPTVEPLSPQVINVLLKGMAVKHDERIQTVDELMSQLDMALGNVSGSAGQQQSTYQSNSAVNVAAAQPVSSPTQPVKYTKPKKKKTGLIIGIIIGVLVIAAGIITPIAIKKNKNSDETVSSEQIADGTYSIAALNIDGYVCSYDDIKDMGYGNVLIRVSGDNMLWDSGDGTTEEFSYELKNGKGKMWSSEETISISYANETITLDFCSMPEFSSYSQYTMDFKYNVWAGDDTGNTTGNTAEQQETADSIVGNYKISEMQINEDLYTYSSLIDLGYSELTLRITADKIYFQKNADSSEVAYDYTLEDGVGTMWNDSEKYTIYYSNGILDMDLASSSDFSEYSKYIMRFKRE